MASGVISEGVLIIASVIVAGLITGIVISKVGTFEGYYTATTEAQKEKMLSKFEIIHVSQLNNTSVNIWIKNTGLTPIQELGSVDTYFGQINSVDLVGYSPRLAVWPGDSVAHSHRPTTGGGRGDEVGRPRPQ